MNWIIESQARSMGLRNHYKMHEVDIFIKDALPKNINADSVFSYITRKIPFHFFSGVDIIYIGNFEVFREKQVNAIYEDGAIYVSNDQDNNQDLIDDIIHEIAHSVEEKYRDLIYGDDAIMKEFLSKRKSLYWILQSNDYKPYRKIQSTYHYDEDIDLYFYKDVGYEAMWHIINGLFPTPYSATSLREYFAIGFETFYINDRTDLKRLCPVLYSKLEELDYLEGQ
jgi:hypothetical protein